MGLKTINWEDLIEHSDFTGKPMGRPVNFRIVNAKDWEEPNPKDKPYPCDCLIHSKRGPKRSDKV